MSEDDGGGLREAAAQTRQPTPRRSAIVDKSDDLPTKLDFERRRQRAPQRRLVDVAVDGVHDWAEGFELLQRRNAEEVTGVDHSIGLTDQLDASLGQAARASRHMGVGEDCDQLGTDSDGRNARKDKDPSDPDPNGAPL